MPYRTMTNIISFIQALDQVVPGFASSETLLYSPELKFYSNRIEMDPQFHTSLPGLACLGDASGWTRGLMMASVWPKKPDFPAKSKKKRRVPGPIPKIPPPWQKNARFWKALQKRALFFVSLHRFISG